VVKLFAFNFISCLTLFKSGGGEMIIKFYFMLNFG